MEMITRLQNSWVSMKYISHTSQGKVFCNVFGIEFGFVMGTIVTIATIALIQNCLLQTTSRLCWAIKGYFTSNLKKDLVPYI